MSAAPRARGRRTVWEARQSRGLLAGVAALVEHELFNHLVRPAQQ
jgi:hypothetical protein